MILGVVGDDFTGSSDIGLVLAEGGMRTVQYVGVPGSPADAGVEAGVVALRSRSIPAADAVRQSLEALDWLRDQGCRQFLLKVCSTFDSTPEGNIGPVAEAMADALGTADPVVVCPAFATLGRTVYRGHLFVGDRLLSESGMESHPLTPMTDPDLARWLARQTRGPVGRAGLEAVEAGAEAARAALLAEAGEGRQLVMCDAVADRHLVTLGRAMEGFALAVGGSGLALGLPSTLGAGGAGAPWEGVRGPAVALAGSCSQATRAQVEAHAAAGHPVRRIDPEAVVEGRVEVGDLARWALGAADEGVPLLTSSDAPEAVAEVQARHGRERAAGALEALFGEVAVALVEGGARRLVVAGGETSGAAVGALGLAALEIGPAIDPGVPALRAERGGRALALALKSGNFGGPDFLARAATVLEGG